MQNNWKAQRIKIMNLTNKADPESYSMIIASILDMTTTD